MVVVDRSACSQKKQKIARSISVECRKDNVFCDICQKGLKVNKSQIIHNFARFAERYFLFSFGFARTRQV